MSTRVDKANQKFKPIGRLRTKPSTPLPDLPPSEQQEPPISVPSTAAAASDPDPDPNPLPSHPAHLEEPSQEQPTAPLLPQPAPPIDEPPASNDPVVTSPVPEVYHEAVIREPSERASKRAKRAPEPAEENEVEKQTAKKPKRARSSAVLDTNIDSGDPIDPTSTSMKDLCSLGGSGRVSSRYVELQVAHAQAKRLEKERRARIAAIREAKDKRGEDIDDPNAQPPVLPNVEGEGEDISQLEDLDATGSFDYKNDIRSEHFSVSMRMDASGNMVVDEDSLIVDRAANPEYLAQMENMTHVEESDASHFVNSASHSRKTKGARWSKEETSDFYEALRQFNTDFTMVSLVMPGRTARECRNKFNTEDKKNKEQIDWALSNPVPIDVAALSRLTGKQFQ